MTDQCNRCRFWRQDDDETTRDPNDPDWGFGHCRREPPRVSETYVAALMPRLEYGQQIGPEIGTVQMTTASLFPATCATDWCGQFETTSSAIMAAFIERNQLIAHLDETDQSEDEDDRDAARMNALDAIILETPATSRENLLVKLLLVAQINTEGAHLEGETAAPLIREAQSILGIGRVSPNVESAREK